jgi:hypothetical protein
MSAAATYYGMPCGCKIVDEGAQRVVRWCPTHAAAPELLELARDLGRGVNNQARVLRRYREKARALLAKIDGEATS